MNPHSEILCDLRVLPCLSGLGDEELSSIGQMARLKSVEKNSALFETSDAVKYFFIVKNGTVKLYKTSHEGRELVVRMMGPGDYFCCAPMFSSGKHYVSAMTLEDSHLIVIPAQDFISVLSKGMTETGMRIISSLCTRIQFLSNLVEDLTFKDVEQRVAQTLLNFAEEKSPGENIAGLTLTHQDIASMTGTVREVVSRVMARLKKEGVIIDSTVKGFRIDKKKLLKLRHKRIPVA
jgi:CRP/FNR family transcriptional regulator